MIYYELIILFSAKKTPTERKMGRGTFVVQGERSMAFFMRASDGKRIAEMENAVLDYMDQNEVVLHGEVRMSQEGLFTRQTWFLTRVADGGGGE